LGDKSQKKTARAAEKTWDISHREMGTGEKKNPLVGKRGALISPHLWMEGGNRGAGEADRGKKGKHCRTQGGRGEQQVFADTGGKTPAGSGDVEKSGPKRGKAC